MSTAWNPESNTFLDYLTWDEKFIKFSTSSQRSCFIIGKKQIDNIFSLSILLWHGNYNKDYNKELSIIHPLPETDTVAIVSIL